VADPAGFPTAILTAMAAPDTSAGGLLRVHALMVLSWGLVATSFPVGAAIAHGLDPKLLTLLRFILASALFAPYVVLRHGLTWPGWPAMLRYATIGACIATFFWCMFEALLLTSALNTGTLFTLVPGISAIYAAVLVRERLGGHRLVALACGLIGALWVIFRGDPARLLALDLNLGDLIFFGGCLAMGFYMPLVRRFHRGEPTAVMTLWVLISAAGWLLLFNNTALWRIPWWHSEGKVFAGIAYLAVFTTIATFFLQQYATPRIGPTRVTSYSYLIPAFVVGIEWLAGQGLPPPMTLPGIAVILIAIVVLQRGAGADPTLG
jgi:drug/metabolite transporter (DMT)-like permease